MHPYRSNFGADSPIPVGDPEMNTAVNLWVRAKLLTPQWVKEAATVAVGVATGIGILRLFGVKGRS